MEVSHLVLKIETSGVSQSQNALRSLDHEIDNVGHHADAASSRFNGLFGVGKLLFGGALAYGAFNLGKGILGLDAQAEQAHIALETVVGSAEKADTIFKNIQDFAASTPFEFPELLKSTINLESFGLNSQKWLPVIGDTAAAISVSVDQVTQAVLDATTGQFERLKELGIRSEIVGDQVVFHYQKNGEDMVAHADKMSQQMIGDTLSAIWSDSYAGAMKKQSKTFNGQFSTLKDNVSIRLQEMSSGVFGFATRSLGFFNDIFANGFVAAVSGTFGDGVGNFVSLVGDMVGALHSAWGEGTTVNSLLEKFPAPLERVGHFLLLVADGAGFLYRQLRDQGLIAALKEMPDILGQVWDGLRNLATQLVDITIDGAVVLGPKLLHIAQNFGGWFRDQFWNRQGAIRAASFIALGSIGLGAELYYERNEEQVNGFAKSVGDSLVDAIGKLSDLGGRIAGKIVEQITSLDWASWITVDSFTSGHNFGAAVHDAIVGAFQRAFDLTVSTDWDLKGIIEKIGAAFVTASTAAPVALAGVTTAITAFFAGAIEGLIFGDETDFGSVIAKISQGVIAAINAASQWATDIADSFVSGLWGAFSSADYSGIGSAIASGIWNSAVGFVSGLPWGSLNPFSGGSANDAFPQRPPVQQGGGGSGNGFLQSFASPSSFAGLGLSTRLTPKVGAAVNNHYYVIDAHVLTRDAKQFVQNEIAAGSARVIDRRTMGQRLLER